MKVKLNSILIIAIVISAYSCNRDDDTVPVNPTNEELPTSIVLKNIPSGTFTMGGSTVQNDAPEVTGTLSAF